MNRATVIAGLCLAACAAGIALGRLTCQSIACRDALGSLFGRGDVLAITQGQGIYEEDVESEIDRLGYASGQDDADSVDLATKRTVLSRLIATATATQLARNEVAVSAQVDRAVDLVRDQFHDQKTWLNALGSNRLSVRSLRLEAAADARAGRWLERQLKNVAKVSSDECRRYFAAHHQNFVLPERLRASHLFLAAPGETPPPIVELKRRTIDSFSVRLSHGEEFSELASATSEDEASKVRQGDLGFFSASRMPSDFFSMVEKMEVGITSPPIQTSLGFHIVRLTDRQPGREMTFAEAEPEILLRLENEKRLEAANQLVEKWLAGVTFLRPDL